MSGKSMCDFTFSSICLWIIHIIYITLKLYFNFYEKQHFLIAFNCNPHVHLLGSFMGFFTHFLDTNDFRPNTCPKCYIVSYIYHKRVHYFKCWRHHFSYNSYFMLLRYVLKVFYFFVMTRLFTYKIYKD